MLNTFQKQWSRNASKALTYCSKTASAGLFSIFFRVCLVFGLDVFIKVDDHLESHPNFHCEFGQVAKTNNTNQYLFIMENMQSYCISKPNFGRNKENIEYTNICYSLLIMNIMTSHERDQYIDRQWIDNLTKNKFYLQWQN